MPEHVGTWHVLGWTQLMQGDVSAAQRAFERALAADRNFAESHGGLAVVAAMQGRDEEARQSIRRALRLNREAMSPQYAQLLLLKKEGRDQEAQALLDDVLARPAPSTDMRYRDLIDAHQRYLRSRAAPGRH
jgi:Tfp pilus assembly protein PilF